jgi:hypothetical protein
MNIFWLAFCLLILNFPVGCSNEIEIDSEGNVISTDMREPLEFPVTFMNRFDDKTLSVNWEPESLDEDPVHMFDIPPMHNSELNTFVGHKFFFTDAEDPTDEILDEIMIMPNKDRYIIGGKRDETSNVASTRPKAKASTKLSAGKPLTPDGRVTVIGYPTTSMSAKFRCLAEEVDYYYDDGGEGTFQGTLTLGKETTTNTYEGHVFYFTKKGNKDEEIVRFTMNKDQVSASTDTLSVFSTIVIPIH